MSTHRHPVDVIRMSDALDLTPKLTYREGEGARLQTQGIDLTVGAPTLSLVESQGGIETTGVVSRHSIQTLCGVDLGYDIEVTVSMQIHER